MLFKKPECRPEYGKFGVGKAVVSPSHKRIHTRHQQPWVFGAITLFSGTFNMQTVFLMAGYTEPQARKYVVTSWIAYF